MLQLINNPTRKDVVIAAQNMQAMITAYGLKEGQSDKELRDQMTHAAFCGCTGCARRMEAILTTVKEAQRK